MLTQAFGKLIEILNKLNYDKMTMRELKFLIEKLDMVQFPDSEEFDEKNLPEIPSERLSRDNALEYVDFLSSRIVLCFIKDEESWKKIVNKERSLRQKIETEVQKIENVIENLIENE